MSRFQAKTNSLLDAELELLQHTLGLRTNQKADLLRELTTLAAWVVHQAAQGRSVLARGDDGEHTFDLPLLERIRDRSRASTNTVTLSEEEARQLSELLDRGFDPPAELRESLGRLADPERQAPTLTWPEEVP